MDLENIKKNELEINNALNEIKNTLQGINRGEADVVYKPCCLGHFVITAQTD